VPDHTVLTVCLPQTTHRDHLVAATSALLATHGLTGTDPACHFRTRTRLRTAPLLQPGKGTAAGGPLRALNLARMRAELSQQYWNRWQLWHQIVAGSPIARSWWQFYDRYAADPQAHTWNHARHSFAGQPRIARMLTYNSHPGRVTELPLEHLDAFEAGAQAYATYGWLQAVPGHSMLTLDGRHLQPTSARYVDQLEYLRQANEHIAELTGTDVLVALTTR
jgi:hypothetical protein